MSDDDINKLTDLGRQAVAIRDLRRQLLAMIQPNTQMPCEWLMVQHSVPPGNESQICDWMLPNTFGEVRQKFGRFLDAAITACNDELRIIHRAIAEDISRKVNDGVNQELAEAVRLYEHYVTQWDKGGSYRTFMEPAIDNGRAALAKVQKQ